MLVHMIRTHFPATLWAKFCPKTQPLADGLLVESRDLALPLTEFTVLALLQDQWMPQELINGILIKGDPLAPHPGVLVSDFLLRRPRIGIELHDYFWIILSHGCCKLSPLSLGNFLLEFGILSIPQLDPPLLEERQTLNCLKAALVFLTSKPMFVKLHIHLCGRTGTFSSGIFPCPLSWKLLWSHSLQGHILKVSLHEIPIIISFTSNTTKA